MNDFAVEKQYISLIVPFAYLRPYHDCLECVDLSRFEVRDKRADRLFDYAEHLVSADPGRHEAIGRRWAIRQAARSALGLPNNHNHPLVCRVKEQEWRFSIHEIEMVLFETQVGFLLYRIQFPDQLSLDEQIEIVYYLKKLKGYGHQLSFEQRLSEDESVTRTVHLNDLACTIINEIEPVTYFEGQREYPTEALVFSSVLLDNASEQVEPSLGSFLFHLRRSFKGTYKAPAEERELSGNADMLRLFDNSSWGISLEGLANLVTRTNDPLTDQFFSTQYFHHIGNTYEYLYILALHQKYAVLHLSNQASEISYELHLHRDAPAETSRLFNQMKERIIGFMLRSSYKQVSRSTHHAALYEWMRSRLKIEDLFNELHETMEALVSLSESAEQKQRLEEEERKRAELELFNKKITGVSAVFLPITIITGMYGMETAWMEPLKELWIFASLTVGTYLVTYVLFKFWFNKL